MAKSKMFCKNCQFWERIGISTKGVCKYENKGKRFETYTTNYCSGFTPKTMLCKLKIPSEVRNCAGCPEYDNCLKIAENLLKQFSKWGR